MQALNQSIGFLPATLAPELGAVTNRKGDRFKNLIDRWGPHPADPSPITTNQGHHRDLQQRLLLFTLGTLLFLFAGELGCGYWSHSLALMADASHVAVDACSIAMSLLAVWLSHRRSRPSSPHSPDQIEIYAALINGCSLLILALGLGVEALSRLYRGDTEVLGMPMLWAALVGLLINIINALWLKSCAHHSLNLRSAFLHILADGVSSVGVVLGAICVAWLGWNWADGVITLLVSGMILAVTFPLLREIRGQLGQVRDHNSLALHLKSCNCSDQPLKVDLSVILFPSLEDMIS
jgi:cobalt-zinc-cadmium efflux system protein